MKRPRWSLLPLAALATTACFHQVVNTGLTAGTTVVDRPWVPTWVFGIVAAKDLDLRAECPTGAATIVTEQSFLNGLVGVLTIGIYTPQHVTVTCASGTGRALGPDADVAVAPGATAGERAEAFRQAVTLSIARHEPVTIRF